MRDLEQHEIDAVRGGALPMIALGIGISTAGGAVAGYHQGGWRGAAVGAVLGAGTAVTGGMATITTGFVRLSWAVRGVGWTAIGSGIASTGQ